MSRRRRIAAARGGRSGSAGGIVPAVLAAALGLGLIVLAAPRLVAALYAAPATATLAKLDRNDATLTPGELLAARQALRLALVWEDSGTASVARARLALALAAREYRAGGDALPFVEETIDAARHGLVRAPAQTRGWLLLSEAMLARTSDPGASAPFLVEAMRASPHELWQAPNRVELGLRAWPWLDAAARQALGEQIRLTAERWPDRLVQIARRTAEPGPIREALAHDAERLRRFDVLYLQSR